MTRPPPASDAPSAASATLDPREVAQFDALAREWWDPDGKMKPLHKLGPARMGYLRDTIVAHFAHARTEATAPLGTSPGRSLAGIAILDVGCGGGLVTEPFARMGATVTGIDPGRETIAAAKAHAASMQLEIDYRAARVEDLSVGPERFDVVTCLEVVEHIPDVGAFLNQAATLVRPGGLLIVSTINRTLRSYALAIVAAEYVLRWLPPGTHDWNRFVKPDELAIYLKRAGLEPPVVTGLVLDPISDVWRLSKDDAVNYFAASAKPA